MKKAALLILFISLVGFGQPPQAYYNEALGWSITVPKPFMQADLQAWKGQQEKGLAAFRVAYKNEVTQQDTERAGTTLAVFREGGNFLEARLQADIPAPADEREEDFRFEVHLMEETFKRQVPGASVTPTFTSEEIDGIEFLKAAFVIALPDGRKFCCHSYSGIVNGKSLRINIAYTDITAGKTLLTAWRNSDFNSKKHKL